jgi:hypothetical protein
LKILDYTRRVSGNATNTSVGLQEKISGDIQSVREWFPKNFRVSLSGKMWSKTFTPFLDKLNRFLKINLFPAVLGLLKYCFVQEKNLICFDLKMIAW